MDAIYREEYKGHKISIYIDELVDGPREWENLGKMICWHNRYNLGDEQPREDPQEWLHQLALSHTEYDEIDQYSDRFNNLENMTDAQLWDILNRHYIFLPLYLYDHSGITMNTSGFHCPWDSGQVGWIYVSLEDVRKEYGKKRVSRQLREKVEEYLKSEVKVYDQYLRGEVYGFVVEDQEGEHVNSCWGFYGDYDGYVLEEARQSI